MNRKQHRMYELFGKTEHEKCKSCQHLKGGVNDYRKCRIYGVSASEATDWALSWDACGLWNQPYDYEKFTPIVRLNVGGAKKQEIHIDGQMNLFSVVEDEELEKSFEGD